MKKLPTWPKVNEAFYGLVEAVKGQPFVTPSEDKAEQLAR